MTLQNEKHESILQRIAKGRLSLGSKKEYEDLLTLFPDKADPKRAYADFLILQNENKTAYRYYLAAADLYIKDGKTMQAIVSKILAWRIIKPTHQEGRIFHAALQASLVGETPLQHFFAGMPYAEFITMMLKFTRLQLAAGQKIIRAGNESNALFFIVSGELQETFDAPEAMDRTASKKISQRLFDNDIFGEIFPLDKANICQWNVVTLTPAEVVKISKPDLLEASRKYPLIAKFLTKAYKGPAAAHHQRSWMSIRRSTRHAAPIKIDLTIALTKQAEQTMNLEAMSRDISLGGVCIDLGPAQADLTVADLAGSKAGLSIHLPNSDQSLAVNGTIVWSKKVKDDAGINIVAGIQFEPLGRDTRDLLNVYCFGIDNEQTLMWSLWDTYMAE